MSRFAIMRLQKVHTFGQIGGLGKHLERERTTLNADPELTWLNEHIVGSGDWVADVKARLAVAPIVRKNAVLAIEFMITASPEYFGGASSLEKAQRRDAWRDASMTWLRENYGADNVVGAVLHRDERTPHIQALVVPIDFRGRLNSRGFLGGDRRRLAQLQDSYAAQVAPLGLERGVRGSVAHHQDIQRWYGQMQESMREMGHWHVREDTEGYQPERVMVVASEEEACTAVKQEAGRAYKDARDEWLRNGPMDEFGELLSYVDHDYEPTQSVSATDAWVHYGLGFPPDTHIWAEPCHEPDCKLDVASRRGIWLDDPEREQENGLERIVTALGAERDRTGHLTLWGERLTVEGVRWRWGRQSGRGAWQLAQDKTGYSDQEVTAWLVRTLSGGRAVGTPTRQFVTERDTPEQVELDPRPPFLAPERDDREWAWVRLRGQLIVRHSLPVATVDRLHAEGRLYADRQGRAVWLHQDEGGQVTGATLERQMEQSATIPSRVGPPEAGSTLVASGSREGWFGATLPAREGPGSQRRTLILADTPAEALAAAEMHHRLYGDREAGPVTVVAVDQTGRIPVREVGRVLGSGGVVRVAVKDDRLAERIGGQLPAHQPEQIVRDQPMPGTWCEALRQHDLATRDPKRADRELHEKWRQNAPDERSRASLREAVQRWGPQHDQGRDGHEH